MLDRDRSFAPETGATGVETPYVAPRSEARRSDTLVTPLVSLVVPTRNEEGNIGPLCTLLEDVLSTDEMEVIFVDDSDDDTPAQVHRAARRSRRRITLLHREPEERANGLGGAVVAGMRIAKGEYVCVMDADLQHPPEVIARMLAAARAESYDLVAASRFRGGGDADELGLARKALSWVSKQGARAMFPDRLRAVSDPMSGFFLVRRAAVDLDRLQPRGFKILVEILVRTPSLRYGEVEFHFGERHSGESKANVKEAYRYLAQLFQARVGDTPLRFARFGVVGLSGLVVNTLALALFAEVGNVWYALSAILATQVSTGWNFALSDRWVFRDHDSRRGLMARAGLFFATNNAAMLIRIPLLLLLTEAMGINYLLSNVLSLVSLTVLRFGVSDTWIWGAGALMSDKPRHTGAWRYDIHGLMTVESDTKLPELERFMVDELVEEPFISVQTKGRRSAWEAKVDPEAKRIRYSEALGRLGFACDIAIGGRINVRGTRLMAMSPHVLYTNVVEPILRWQFAERGYALVHAACITDGDRALLLTARTDTGKTTTALKLLDSAPFGFVSDDLTLLCPDGRVLCYPKPLTISRHTLHAVKTPLLGRRQRIGLVLQSRLHSRSGRRFAFLIAKMHLPAATINAITQLIVPPPKYQVDKLVPSVRIASEARVEKLAIIVRGGTGDHQLAHDEALSVLLANCEDAYGFPPYNDIEGFLHSRDGARLQAVERATIAKALEGVDAVELRSETMDWWTRIGGVLGVAPQPEPAAQAGPAPVVTSAAPAPLEAVAQPGDA